MEDTFKKFVYTSVGMVSNTVEQFQKAVNGLVDKDKISADEGKKIVDDLFKNTEAKREEFESKLKKIVEEVMGKMNVASAKQVSDLEARVAALEDKLGIVHEATSEGESKKKAPEKVAVEA